MPCGNAATLAQIEDAIRDYCGLPEGRVLP